MARYGNRSFQYATSEKLREVTGGRVPAGVYVGRGPNRGRVFLHEDVRHFPKPYRRMILAHEAWHKNVPVLGRSEILAHVYGGLRAGNKPDTTYRGDNHAEVRRAMNDPTVRGQLKHLVRTKPGRAATELLFAGSLAGLGLTAMPAYREWKRQREERSRERQNRQESA